MVQQLLNVFDDHNGLFGVKEGRTSLLSFVGSINSVKDGWEPFLGQIFPLEQRVDHGDISARVQLGVIEQPGIQAKLC